MGVRKGGTERSRKWGVKKGGVQTREIMEEMEMSGWRKEEVGGEETVEKKLDFKGSQHVYRYTPKFCTPKIKSISLNR